MSGPLPSFLAPITIPASWVYGRFIAARNHRYDHNVGVELIGRPVISVGNITTGGTGKTPMVMWIARQLLLAGRHPIIAMRGYKSVNGMSDEQAEYAESIPDVPVIANPDRVSSLRDFFKVNRQFDCVILDDGFQHRQLKRDCDLVLIDATADTFNQRLLPAGHLREPLENLRRADAVIVTRANADGQVESEFSKLNAQIEQHHGKPPIAVSRHAWVALDVHQANHADEQRLVEWLRGKRVLTMLGIGNPEAMIRQLESVGAIVAANVPAADHEQYDRAKIAVARGLCTGCEAMVMSQKDWVKLRHLIDLSSWPAPIVVPRLEIEVFQGADELRARVLAAANRART